jgi:HK97 family phage prohead protease
MIRQKVVSTEVKAVDEESRTITFVMSSEDVDRDGDIIRVDGWKLDAFRQNPVFLVFHDQRQFPIGRVEDIRGEGTQLLGTVRFAEKGTYEVADVAYELYRQGIMNAVSVGFRGLEWEPREDDDGLIFTSQELFELSAVPVPANPAAVAVAQKSSPVAALFTDAKQNAKANADAKMDKVAADLEGLAKRIRGVD